MSIIFMIEVYPQQYPSLLTEKAKKIEVLFGALKHPKLEVHASAPCHFRERVEFKIWHDDEKLSYAMFQPGDKKALLKFLQFPRANKKISELMPPLLASIERNEILAEKLFQIDFLSTLRGDLLVTLIYHKKLSDTWVDAAKQLKQSFAIDIIGRARKQKVVLDKDYVTETLSVAGKLFHYQQVENSFTQPNAGVCEKMLTWAYENSKHSEGDLLELYCGNGNFTIPLSQNFNQVLATEIAKSSVKSALTNITLNQINNIKIARLSSEEISQALKGERQFRRLAEINLSNYQFKTVFVDPPRCGLDKKTLELVAGFDRIIYVSCNPLTLHDNICKLSNFNIEKFALFDQFPYTDHVECGVILGKKY